MDMEAYVGPVPDGVMPMPSTEGRDGGGRVLPAWMMALSGSSVGFVYGFISTAMGILLASRGVPVAKIGAISAISFSPTFWVWVLSPMLDVRFTKRAYGLAFASLAALLLVVAVLSLGNLTVFTVSLTAACTLVTLYAYALGGWAPDLVRDDDYDTFSGWVNIANLAAAGVFGAASVWLVRWLPLPVAAVCLGVLVAAPAWGLMPLFPAPPKPEGTLRANFGSMGRDLKRVARDGRVWIGLLMFVSPASSFALTNLFSSMGADFGASEQWVTSLNGLAVAAACGLGCLLAIPLCRRLRRRTIYLAAGAAAGLGAAAMAVLPHTLAVYASGLLFYNFMQGFGYTAFIALQMEIIGRRNALAGTISAVLVASTCAPISGMTYLESHVHDAHGLRAMLLTDGGISLATIAVLLMLLPLLDRTIRRRTPVANA